MPWYGYALITALSISLVGILQKKTLQNEHSAEYFMVFSFLKVGLFFLFAKTILWSVTESDFLLLALTGVLAGLAFFFVTKALRRLDLSIVAPVLTLDSGLSSLVALIVLHETLSSQQFLGLVLLVVGTYVLELQHHHAGSPITRWQLITEPFKVLWKTPGGIYAILATTCFALSGVVDRQVLKHVSIGTYLAYVLPTMAIVSVITFLMSRAKLNILRRGSRVLFLPIAITAALHLLSNITQAKATALIAIGLVLALKRLSTLIDVVMSGRLFHEHNLRQKIMASLIMLIGVLLVVL